MLPLRFANANSGVADADADSNSNSDMVGGCRSARSADGSERAGEWAGRDASSRKYRRRPGAASSEKQADGGRAEAGRRCEDGLRSEAQGLIYATAAV